jgi:hypothetical protein
MSALVHNVTQSEGQGEVQWEIATIVVTNDMLRVHELMETYSEVEETLDADIASFKIWNDWSKPAVIGGGSTRTIFSLEDWCCSLFTVIE